MSSSSSSELWPALAYHFRTLILFTCRDFKSVVLPSTVFAIACIVARDDMISSPASSSAIAIGLRLPAMLIWSWLNILVLTVSNQSLPSSIIEDQLNRPWRPIPAGRISPQEARYLLIAAVLATLFISHLLGLGIVAISVALFFLSWAYNETYFGNESILGRSFLTATGAMCYNWGAVVILADVSATQLSHRGFMWLFIAWCIVITTFHATDIPDMEGDAARGRRTVPLVFGDTIGRTSVSLSMAFWTAFCPVIAGTPGLRIMKLLPASLALLTGTLFHMQRGHKTDKRAWTLCCLWITAMNLTPLL
ncbi:UbiA prenyltransferase family-domain-containing protein [Auriculariales sp. MPI-PUGE-AT-0066]|nr:UbiA prenyltransferase family-domain-containing protein [Auriculariales sp. MPI-PUGE-AT-0066]